MNAEKIEDVLSWDNFFSNAKKRKPYPPEKIELFNRLMCHTNNFFLIAAIGAFTPGYVMLITKKLLPSMSMIQDSEIEELKWLVKTISSALKTIYNREVISFEHGMCSCVGGLDRAHLHIMPISKNISNEKFINSIDKVLLKRRAGIESVEVNGHKLDNLHDIAHIMDSAENNSYKVHGKQLTYKDIYNNLDLNNWPISARDHSSKGGHYVYFKTKDSSTSFLTNKNFQTQLGRQIAFELEMETNQKIKDLYNKITSENKYANIWKWQEFPFNENILKTINDLFPVLLEIQKIKNNYNFKSFEKI